MQSKQRIWFVIKTCVHSGRGLWSRWRDDCRSADQSEPRKTPDGRTQGPVHPGQVHQGQRWVSLLRWLRLSVFWFTIIGPFFWGSKNTLLTKVLFQSHLKMQCNTYLLPEFYVGEFFWVCCTWLPLHCRWLLPWTRLWSKGLWQKGLRQKRLQGGSLLFPAKVLTSHVWADTLGLPTYVGTAEKGQT